MPTFKLAGGAFQNTDEVGLTVTSPLLINAYVDAFGNTIKKPGLSEWVSLGDNTAINGIFDTGLSPSDYSIYAAGSNGELYAIRTSDLSVSKLAGGPLLTGDYPARFCTDGAYLWVADGGQMVKVSLSGLTQAVVPADAPQTVTHVVYWNNRIVCNNMLERDQWHYTTDPTDKTSWKADGYYTAEYGPDNIAALTIFRNELIIFGFRTIETWYDDGVSPFSRLNAGCYDVGICGPYAYCYAGGALWWLTNERRLANLVGRTITYVDSPFQKVLYEMGSAQDAILIPLEVEGQGFVLLQFPSSDVSLLYNYRLNQWQQWGLWNETLGLYERDKVNCSSHVNPAAPSSYNSETSTDADDADDSSIGTRAWSDVSYATDDSTDTYASVSYENAGDITHYLWMDNWGFSIPAGATILGVEVYVWRESTTGIVDYSVKLVKGGVVSGDNKASDYSESGNYKKYGGVYDLWGNTLSDTDVNSVDFGCVLSFKASFVWESLPNTTHVRDVFMKIYYTESSDFAQVPYAVVCGTREETGKIYVLSRSCYTDDGDTIRVLRRSGPITYNTLKNKRVNKLSIRMSSGVGNADEADPKAKLRWRDNFREWSDYEEIPLGNAGDAYTTYQLNRLGVYSTRQYEIVYDEPTEFTFVELEEEVTLLR